jgi:hypothetical protein
MFTDLLMLTLRTRINTEAAITEVEEDLPHVKLLVVLLLVR